MKALKIALACAGIFGAGLGLGTVVSFVAFLGDHPSIVVETKWKTITTSPPVTYSPETPFHVDPVVICDTTTTTTTSTVPPPLIPPTVVTTMPLPPSTLPPSSTTSTIETQTEVSD